MTKQYIISAKQLMKEKLKKYLTVFKLCCFIYVSNKQKCTMSLYAVYIDLK